MIESYLVEWFELRTVLELARYGFLLEGDVIQSATPEVAELVRVAKHGPLTDLQSDYGQYSIGPLVICEHDDGAVSVMHSGLIGETQDAKLVAKLKARADGIRKEALG